MADTKSAQLGVESPPGYEAAAQEAPPVAQDPAPPGPPGPAGSEDERRVRQSIEENATKNIDLLQQVSSTEDSVHALQNNQARLQHLEEELTVQSTAAREAAAATKETMGKYTKNKDSFGRKWVYVLTNMRKNLESKTKESEQAYIQAMSVQNKAEQRERQLLQDKTGIERENEGLLKEAKKHEEAHAGIDRLYEHIFNGPTPGFADEDEKEAAYKASKQEHDDTIASLKEVIATYKEVDLLRTGIIRAGKERHRARYELDTALFSGTEYAIVYLDRCGKLLDQTLQVSRSISERELEDDFQRAHQTVAQHMANALTAITTALRGSYAYASSSKLYGVVQNIHDELGLAQEARLEVARMMKEYEKSARHEVRTTSRSKENARQALQEVRQNAFEITVGHGAAAPAYHECCDRAAGFESDANEQCERMPDPTIDDSGLPPPPSYETAVGAS